MIFIYKYDLFTMNVMGMGEKTLKYIQKQRKNPPKNPYVDHQPLGLTWGEEKSNSPFVSTLSPPSRHGPDMQVFQQASGSPDQAYPDPRCVYVGYRPVYGPSALHLPRQIWRGIVAAPTDVP